MKGREEGVGERVGGVLGEGDLTSTSAGRISDVGQLALSPLLLQLLWAPRRSGHR